MAPDFDDLEVLAQQAIGFSPKLALTAQLPQYQNATLEEIFNLLEGTVEPYAELVTGLPPTLQQSAQLEIEFFALLLQERLTDLLEELDLKQFQPVFQFLSRCA